ncbi:protein kinase STUNTED [Daucus carota subsp. sativus]|uniref:protein kinase STUNTED n=1 Tax=Daucus carota subsp. sativus TaxID=79200 RepID=UPI0007B24165|nr:PREDICTED: probable receptor-like serine/threonine-protein kinase At5g57670 [Daucus carota subsp. sativus]XP_017227945.1 PREDICTED: probable receptor-like serine/threonine-protein kinase At5g57670 [Daucus carota subsp. sativus]
MTVEDVINKNVLVGIRFDGHTKELLDWALVKVADPGDRVIALHVCRNSAPHSSLKEDLDGILDEYDGLCLKRKIDLTGEVLKGSSIRKVIVREAKSRAAMAVIVGISKPHTIGGWASLAKYCAKNLPITTEVLAFHKGKVVFRRSATDDSPSFLRDPKPSICLIKTPTSRDGQSEFGDSELSEIGRNSHEGILSCEDGWRESKYEDLGSFERHRKSLSALSTSSDFVQQRPGWPLLQAASISSPPIHEARKMSVVSWVMSLPNRSSSPGTPGSNSSLDSVKTEFFLGRESSNLGNSGDYDDSSKGSCEIPEALELLKTNSSSSKWFSYDVLKSSTCQFSSGHIIGKGGCNSVYKGILSDGKAIAVKISKSSREAWEDFSQEVDIMTSLNHKNITPLLGVCVEEKNLYSVYDYMAGGDLEENLNNKNKVLSWDTRLEIALGIAEGLNYLHNECSQPVIHRDVKSSNILLTKDYKPMISDFGLAIWAPTNSTFITHTDVVGTFGYLAPEYFMYGKVSDKVDVYSFGVVLLELLSGKKAIGFESPKGQESLVMWAKEKLESGDLISVLDQNLENNVDKDQIQRLALAAILCLRRSARIRPKMSQILKILRGEKDVEYRSEDQNYCDDQMNNDDEVYPESSVESHISLALLDVDEDSVSLSSTGQSSSRSLEAYLKGRWSRSLSLD